MSTPSLAAADLKARWHELCDLVRPGAVCSLKHSGVSTRAIAFEIPASESGLRPLLETLQAPLQDQVLARDGKIPTSELIRRARADKALRAAKHKGTLNLKRQQQSVKGSKAICDWLVSEGVPTNFGAQIVGEARRYLINAEETKQFPPGTVPPGTPVAEIIRRSRPDQPKENDQSQIAWRAYWPAVWVNRAMPDEWVRYKAVELALEKQFRGR
jgi:hypothetical protein